MDGRSFDALARTLGSVTTRRAALRAMLGGAATIATGATLAHTEGASARCGQGGERCNSDAACCLGTCKWKWVWNGRRRYRVGTCAQDCAPNGQACANRADCCSGICDYNTDTCVRCGALNVTCITDSECCDGYRCYRGTNYCRRNDGGPCSVNDDCMSGCCDPGTSTCGDWGSCHG